MEHVKSRRRGGATISSKHQVTIPIEAMRQAGLKAGQRVIARADGAGRVVLERETDVLAEYAGTLSGVYRHETLDQLRDEWE